jgi:TonB family protein
MRPTLDERHARQVAVLVAIAAHLFVFVWLLRDFHPPAPQVEAPPMVFVDVLRTPSHATTSTAPIVQGHAQLRRTPLATHSSAESRPAVATGALAAGAGSNDINSQADGLSTAGVSSGAGVRGSLVPPRVLRRAPGDYPEAAFRAGAEGRTQILVTIDADDRLVDARVASSSGNAALDEASLGIVRRYLFKAGRRDGIATQMDAYVDVGWTITPAVIRQYANSEIVLALPAGLATRRAPTRFGSWMKIAKENAAEHGE